ncbi:MAG: hypothetical protein E6923_04065 [Clostridium sp.]|uniref:hypothetical protein n=1 Tax=Clostridium sp. TaxID=1506 RepID=UPI0028FDF1E6|nr:hypothetical protein [Clostridium sp.]MDU1309884.1 hypothetical protein [Clostridium sp.]MDU1407039.1 hypothetical protein [Clostridium sp.]
MDNLREKARKFRSSKEFSDALEIYKDLLNNDKHMIKDKWLGWEYADTLKKTGDIDGAIKVCKEIYKNNRDFKYIKDLLVWCLYEKYLKLIKVDNIMSIHELNKICNVGWFILDNSTQQVGLPYESTVLKIVKVLDKSKINDVSVKILQWIERIDIDKLSKDSKKIQLNDKKEINLASNYEELVYIKIKSLYNLKRYKECVANIDQFLNSNIMFHNDRDKWVKRIRAKSMFYLGEKDVACEEMEELSKLFNNWVIKFELAKLYKDLGFLNKAIYYSSLALIDKGAIEKKISLLDLHITLLKDLGLTNEALLAKEYLMEIKDKKVETLRSNKKQVITTCFSIINQANGRKEGKLKKIFKNGKSGYIESEDILYYFTKNNIVKGYMELGRRFTFTSIDSFDKKKNINTVEAIEIVSC